MSEKRRVHSIHPGEGPADEFQELEVTPAEPVRALHVSSNRLYQFFAGKRAMTVDPALRMEQWRGVSATAPVNLQ